MSQDESTGSSGHTQGARLISVLRLVAVALLVVGFSGWLLDDGGEVTLESPFTIAFSVGVICALASIYLGVFLANRD